MLLLFFPDKASTKKITPEFMAFCKKAAEGQPPIKEDIEVQLKIKCGGKEIKDDEFLQGLKRKLIKDLKSNKRLRSILDQEDKEHHDIMIDEE